MLPTDQDVIKANIKLLTKTDDSFIHVTDKAAKDMSDNTVDVVPTAKALATATPHCQQRTQQSRRLIRIIWISMVAHLRLPSLMPCC